QQKLADTLAYFGEPKEAAEIYLKLIAAQEDADSDVWRDILRERLANLYLMQNDKTNASVQLEGIVRDNPTKYPQAHYVLGTIAYDQKKFARAAEHFEKAILLSPDLEAAYYDLAGTDLNLNQPERALSILDKARAKFKEKFVNEFFTAIAYNKLKKPDEALKHYSAAEMIATASDTNRLDHTFYFQLGACHERVKHYTEAEQYFEKALAKSPNDAETLNYLGYMWAEQGTNLVKARELIEKALKLEPKNAAYLDSLGWVLFKSNQSPLALPYILKAIELSEEPDATVYDHLGDIYTDLKQPDKAREAWKKSLSIESTEEVKKKLGSTL
ncbi:MAG: Tetratricopeptide 2 repeat protein, partial [Verrucomicrobiales bacterium]|nr:Tetratricopeptide 2 repeat protein [Verrucomicrobiales bacterium]